MKHLQSILILFVLAVFSGMPALSQEQPAKRSDIPRAVLEAFSKAYPKATIKGFSRETEKGATVYEVESVEGETLRDVTYTAEGKVLSVEESMSFSALPMEVSDAVTRDYPGAECQKCEKVQEHGVTTYELLLEVGDVTYEVVYRPDGTLAKKEQKSEKDEMEEKH